MTVTLQQFFSLGDGRLSTSIVDVYKMLSFIFDADIYTHQIPVAMRKLIEVNPEWFVNGVAIIDEIKQTHNTDDFEELMHIISEKYPTIKIELGKIDYEIEFLAGLI